MPARSPRAWVALLAACGLSAGCTSGSCGGRFEGWPRPPSDVRVCCGDGLILCARACTDLQGDRLHCGACGRACSREQSCVAGACACGAGESLCGDACVSLLTDGTNCGVCGRACAEGTRCADGACVCMRGTACGDGCVDTDVDRRHCGGCGRACSSQRRCEAGRCVTDCADGMAACDPAAPAACDVDLATSPAHCGRCFRACGPGESCVAGACRCADEAARCEGGGARLCAMPTMGGPDRCGPCGARCAEGQRCVSGACACPPGQALCGGACAALDRDRASCGQCGLACAAGEDCAGSRCVPRAAPRLLGPPSGAVLAGRRPTFRWLGAWGDASARVEVCRDRACAARVAEARVAGEAFTPAEDLPAGVLFWRVRGLRADGVDTAASATWPLRTSARPGAGGVVVGGFVDVNGDGFADHVEPMAASGVCVYLGGPGGLRRGSCRAYAAATTTPEVTGSVAPGDFDGDGFTDVALRPGDRAGRPVRPVLLLRGAPAGLALAEGFWDASGPWPPPTAAIHGVGDLDLDGYADLATYQAGTSPTELAVHGGGPAGRFWLPRRLLQQRADATGLGGAPYNAGDLDRDGAPELVVEPASRASGAPITVYAGGSIGARDPAAYPLPVALGAEGVSAAGDFDGDDFGDLAAIGGGPVWVWRGGRSGLAATPEAAWPRGAIGGAFAGSFDGARDVNGDGRADIVAVLRAGSDVALQALADMPGGLQALGRPSPVPTRSSSITPPVAWLGDVNRDGFDDVVAVDVSELLVYLGGTSGLPEFPSQRLPLAVGP